MIVKLKLDKSIFNEIYYPYLKCMAAMLILFGGSSSGKSKFSAQRCVYDICQGGRNYLCVRKVRRTIKQSMFNEIVKVIKEWHMLPFFNINNSEYIITCSNGYQVLFAGLDDVEKVKSITPEKGVITDIWIEEATEVDENDIKQLQRRLRGKTPGIIKRILLTFNPILQDHFIYAKYFTGWIDDGRQTYDAPGLSILKTTYRDNRRFLDQGDIDILENETDKYYRDVYTDGNWGVLGNLIFKNWEVRDLRAETTIVGDREVPLIETFNNFKNGLDFGFSQDPAALSRSHYDKTRKTIYITDEIYERELTNDMLVKELKPIIGNEYVKCDSAEPKSIKELRVMGIRALGARKGKDSINFGIDWLQRQKIVIDMRCVNAKKEFMQYKWKEDKDGNVMKVPVDKNNHFIDGTRYAYEDEMENRVVTAERAFM